MRFATIALAFTILTGCFPHNAKHRRQAKWVEGGAIAGGIAFLTLANTGADCMAGPANRGTTYDDCRRNSTIVGDIGLGLILAGLAGFAVTTIMVEEKPPEVLQPIASEDKDVADPDAPKPALPNRTATRPNKH
jgi:hypothetical protein